MSAALDSATVSPSRIDRYEVIGHLAAGGMAEILLGRVPGESGFVRAVVIKRVLQHLARNKEFESMFLDEARIVSGIHHPNVVQVFDLGRDGDELFMVMEYLEGESAAGLMRRLALLGETLDPYVAAHIVAQTCAGLQAAHELTDAEGNPQNLVHRDVNPQNVFIGYDGSVKLIDFGVAKAVDRISRTEAGQLKGKFSYMSPEQCRGQILDRRSDIFALGIVLYELGTGHRLYHQPTEMLTFRAICNGSIVAPSVVRSDFPQSLEKISLKALRRDRSQRYATAAEMRRELLAALRGWKSSEPPDESLAALMRRVFADRIEEKTELMRRVRSGSAITRIPDAETDLGAELPSVVFESDTTAAEPMVKQRKGWLVAALAGVVIVGGAFALREQPTEQTFAPPEVEPATTAPSAAGSARAPDERVVLSIATDPPGARVIIAGTAYGVTPLDVPIARSTKRVALQLERPGHAKLVEEVVPDRDQKLRLRLAPIVHAPLRRAAPTAAPGPSGYYQF